MGKLLCHISPSISSSQGMGYGHLYSTDWSAVNPEEAWDRQPKSIGMSGLVPMLHYEVLLLPYQGRT